MDRKEYFPKVESYLGKYMKWKSRLAIIENEIQKLEPSITPNYSDIPPSVTNKTSDMTGEMAIKRAELAEEYHDIADKIYKLEIAIQALTDDQKKVFELRYVRDMALNNSLNILNVGKDKYYEIRNKLVDTVHEIIQDSIY